MLRTNPHPPRACLCLLLLFGVVAVGCVKRVNLPQAPPFPRASSHRQPKKEAHRTIHAAIDRIAPQIWNQLEQHWQVKRLSGKISILLYVQGGQVLRCVWRRSQLKASIGRPLARPPFPLHGPRPQPSRFALCAFLRQQTWPTGSETSTVVVEHLVERKTNPPLAMKR